MEIPATLAVFDLNLHTDKFTQEFRLASPSGGTPHAGELDWLVGAFYTDERTGNQQLGNIVTPSNAFVLQFQNAQIPTRYTEYAAFGDATYHFTDKFDVTAGLRVSEIDQSFKQLVNGLISAPVNISSSSNESVVNFQVNARYHFNDDTMAYARVASGYRPGGANFVIPGFALPATFGADKTIDYELGYKSEFLEHRALFDASVYYIDWQKIQVSGFAGCCSFITNGQSAAVKGAEVTTSYSPFGGFTLGANGAYTDAELTSSDIAHLGAYGVDGALLPNVPKWSGALTADYQHPVADAWNGRIGVAYRYIGDRLGAFPSGFPAPPPNFRDNYPAYSVVDLNAGLSNDRWSLRAYAKNLFDKRGFVNGTGLGNYYTIIQPRTVGVAIDATF